MASDYEDSCEGDTIRLTVSGAVDGETTWFLLRTHEEEVEAVSGASLIEVEEGAYLVAANQAEVTLRLKPQNELYYTLSD